MPRAQRFGLIREVASELTKVTWPTREETTRLTVMVIAVSAVVGVILGVTDYIFTLMMDGMLR